MSRPAIGTLLSGQVLGQRRRCKSFRRSWALGVQKRPFSGLAILQMTMPHVKFAGHSYRYDGTAVTAYGQVLFATTL